MFTRRANRVTSLTLFFESPRSIARRETVELRGGKPPVINLSSPRNVPVGTTVRIRSGRENARGLVQQCKTDRSRFLVTIQIQRGGQWLLELFPASNFDPGSHSVDKFISEERFSQLMNVIDSKARDAR